MIDWDRVNTLREEVGAEDFDEVVALFLGEVDAEIALLGETPPGMPLAEKLHSLKGSALSLGFDTFSALCQTAETSAADPETQVDLAPLLANYSASRAAFLAQMDDKLGPLH